ncbi:MAG: ArsR/SmtB family transcription factor [Candidatus Binatia bacterium]
MKKIVKVFKTLSDETRLRILHLLSEAGEMCVCDIESVLGCPQTRVSRHLAILKNSGLIEDRRDGLWILYSLTNPADSVHRAVLKAIKDIVSSVEDFATDKKKLRQAVARGRCKTFRVIMPEAVPKFLDR